MNNKKNKFCFTNEQIADISNRDDLVILLKKENVPLKKLLKTIKYNEELYDLQVQLLKLQNWIRKKKKRVVIVFEGRDAAGKGGTIRRFTRFLNPRSMRVVALNKPTSVERGQWYFRRHVKELPNPGEIVFFDRSWYNRAVVEPVMGFCTKKEYVEFIRQVPEFEHMLFETGVTIIKIWFSISKNEQDKRFKSRQNDPLKQWKLSPVDIESRKYWDKYTYYKEEMFIKTHTSFAPWIIVKSNDKKIARLEAIRYVLSRFEYNGKKKTREILSPDPNIVQRFHRSIITNS
ncbi:MAG: polyphosphate kinase 2 [Flavobacteriaceae bacterium]|nr:polyphosphate kinase 2 [Flavobacteriaceae bacterium]